jgi:rhodanese-related sulfurtransferase
LPIHEFLLEGQNLWLVVIAAGSAGMLLWPGLRSGKSASPTDATLLINREDALVVDIRDAAEFASGHLPEAKNIPLDKLGSLDEKKDRPILLVCASGVRSGQAVRKLAKSGYARAVSLEGGIDAWRAAKLPIVKEKGKRK